MLYLNKDNLAIANMQKYNPFEFEDIEDTEDSGEAGGSGASGFSEPIIDLSLFGFTNFEYLELIRKEEGKLGKGVPFTKDPNKKKQEGSLQAQGAKSHPLLNTQRQDGVSDTRLDVRTNHNNEAQEKYAEYQLKHALTPAPGQQNVTRPSIAPTLRPGGG